MSKHDLTFSSHKQTYWACAALLNGQAISHQDEIAQVQGWRLAAIISRLKKKYDWPIATEYLGPQRYARYNLVLDCDLSNLQFPRSAKRLAEGVQ